MSDSSDPVDVIVASLDLRDTARAARAVEKLGELKGTKASRALAELMLTAPAGPITARLAAALERRKHKTILDTLHQAYDQRPEIWEDVIVALLPIADENTLRRMHRDAKTLMRSPARLAALELWLAVMEKRPLGVLLLDLRYNDANPAANEDIEGTLEAVLKSGDDSTLVALGAHAASISPEARALVQPHLPPESELEREAPRLARDLLREMGKRELIELVPGAEDALVEQLARTMIEARSPKGLLRDVERILESSSAIEELYASKDDIKKILEALAKR